MIFSHNSCKISENIINGITGIHVNVDEYFRIHIINFQIVKKS